MHPQVSDRQMEEPVQWWGVAWAWVGGYSATATLVTIFNMPEKGSTLS